jgi:hypothetical protein
MTALWLSLFGQVSVFGCRVLSDFQVVIVNQLFWNITSFYVGATTPLKNNL